MRAGMPIAEDLRELSRTIVTKVARETASILHTRNDLGALDDPIDEAEFCDEAEALATGEECGCLEPDESIEGSLMVWVENSLRERVSASEERERVLREALREARQSHSGCCIVIPSLQTAWQNMGKIVISGRDIPSSDYRCAACRIIDDALATPAPQQPAKKESE